MGWKASCMFVSTGARGYFGTKPKHMPERVPHICSLLGIKDAKRTSTLPQPYAGDLQYLRPENGTFALGVYEKGLYYASDEIYDDGQTEFYEKVKEGILSEFPVSQTLVIQLASGVNLFGYALYHSGELIRAYGGHGAYKDDEITKDVGPIQFEEQPHFERSRIKDGKRVFRSPSSFPFPFPFDELSAATYGEELVFAMTSRFLGKPINGFDGLIEDILDLELFQKLA